MLLNISTKKCRKLQVKESRCNDGNAMAMVFNTLTNNIKKEKTYNVLRRKCTHFLNNNENNMNTEQI